MFKQLEVICICTFVRVLDEICIELLIGVLLWFGQNLFLLVCVGSISKYGFVETRGLCLKYYKGLAYFCIDNQGNGLVTQVKHTNLLMPHP